MALLERDAHLAMLSDRLDDAVAGRGSIVLLSGEAGIGKTSLLQQFVNGQRRPMYRSARVLWGGCEALFTPHPLAPLFDIARQAGGAFALAISGTTARDALFNLTMDQLAQGPFPTVLIFEDVHWADEATLDLIKYLGRRLQRLGIVLVISYRADEVGDKHPLRAVIGDLPSASVHRLELEPLSADAVASLAAAAGRAADRLHEITGGNPFFVTEALAVGADGVPATVRDAVIARLARLSDEARDIAGLVALVPGKAERWLLEKTVGDSAAAIQECLAVGMVAQPDGSVAFRHELARRTLEEYLPVAHRQDLHACILRALLQHIGSEIITARIVHHADLALKSEIVLRYAPKAAERASELSAHREASAYYQTALRHADALTAEERAELKEKLAYELYLTEYIDEAIVEREAALAYWRTDGCSLKIGDNLRWLSRLSWFNGRNEAARHYADEAIAVLEAVPASRELAMAYSNQAQLDMLANNAGPALRWGQKAIDLATPLGDTEILSHAFNNVGTAKATSLDLHGWQDLEHSLALALGDGLQEHAARAYTNLATSAIRIRDFARATQYLADGLAYCEKHGLDSWLRYMTASQAMSYLAQGDWEHATEDAMAVFLNPCTAPVSKIQALVVLGTVRLRRGDTDADAPLNEALALAMPTHEVQRIGPVVAARAEAAWLQGRLAENAAEIREALTLAHQQADPWMEGELAFWSWRAGDAVTLESSAAEPFALQVAGKWREAAAVWHAMGCTYEQAMALSDSEAEADLREALAIAEGLNAAGLAVILRRKLRAGGARRISRGVQERHRQSPHGLTTRELGVLALLAEGGRNADIARRLFVSEKTVDHHVSSILGKLGVRSRGEAAAAAYRLGLVTAAQEAQMAGK